MAKAPKTSETEAAPIMAGESSEDGPAKAGLPGEIIKVRGPEDGRWRGGLQFGPIEREVDLSTVTPEDLAAIEADPYLSVKRS